jgi:hypothetical protein
VIFVALAIAAEHIENGSFFANDLVRSDPRRLFGGVMLVIGAIPLAIAVSFPSWCRRISARPRPAPAS